MGVPGIDRHSTICTLLKALYELKQEPRTCISKIVSFLKILDFISRSGDPCFYISWKDDGKVMIIAL